MSGKRAIELTPEQLAIAAERKAKRLRQQAEAPTVPHVSKDRGRIVKREWISLKNRESDSSCVKIATWNLLAQCLVRRELFPTSTCLKASQREHMIYNEILSHNADILCLQEVDRLEQLIPVLASAGYDNHYASGPLKKHGCMIAFKRDKYTLVAHKRIQYDELDVRSEGDAQCRRGSSFYTKNIANLVALKSVGSGTGCIVATTHLFWHPRYTYERARQAGLLKREVLNFRSENENDTWPCFVAGDFNAAPDDAAYSLIIGDPIISSQEKLLDESRVVHRTIDPTVPLTSKKPSDESEEGDDEKKITSARPAGPPDGLLSSSELTQLFASSGPVFRSAYDEGIRQHRANGSERLPSFGDRVAIPSERKGAFEPEWTSYTHYWKTVLDYVFILDSGEHEVTGILAPHKTKDIEKGLPQQDVCGSDHVSLCAEFSIPSSSNSKAV